MKIKLIIATMLITLTTGCTFIKSLDAVQVVSYAIDSSVLVTSLVDLDSAIKEARESVNENKDRFSTEEWSRLTMAGQQIDEIRANFGKIFGENASLKTRLLSSIQLKGVVGDVFDVYDDVEEIVLIHADNFSTEQRISVLTAKSTLDNLRDSYHRIKDRSKNAESVEPIDATETVKKAVAAIKKIVAVLKR